MTVTTNIKQMKLNVVTQQQYDSMTKNANELYAVTDASISYKELSDKPAVTSLPTASISNEGDIYQYIGVTDQYYIHGYFYECVSDGAVTPTYSWEQLDVQPAGSSLPSQTGNAGKFLTTDGTDASWATLSGGSIPTLTWYSVSTAGNTLTIADTSSAQLVKIYKNGLLLEPTADYTISGTTLTMVTALVVGDKITTEVF